MGKRKGKREPAAALVTVDDTRHPFRSAQPSLEILDWLDTPLLTASLDATRDVPESWGDARLLLSPDALYAAHLYTNQPVLVGISTSDEASLPEGKASSDQQQQQPATQRTPDNIWGGLHARHGCDPAFAVEPAQLGSFVTPATVWPGPRLPSGTAALSRSLAAALGRPSPGATLCLYAWPGGAQAFSGQEAAAVTPVATEVSLWQCTSSFTGQPLMLDQGTSAVVGNPTAGESPAGRPAAASAMPVYSGTPKQRSSAEEAAKRLLTGRRLLPGNLVVLPVLGKQVVLAVRDCSHAGGACSDWEAVTVGSNTAVHVLLGADTPACAAAPANGAAPHEALSAEEAAAAAAAAAVGGGLEGPAAVAARRAAALGQAALRHGFAGLGGVSEQIRALRKHVALPLQAPHLFERLGLRPVRGVLLHGPPGSGKTVLACAAAADAGAALFVLNGPDIISEYHGESEAGLQGVVAAARAAAPAVVFLDELDALAPARGSGASGSGEAAGEMSARLVASLLTAMDGSGEGTSGADRVIFVAATNRVDAMDAALRRPGRFDRELEIGVPSPAGRLEILRVKLGDLQHSLQEEDVCGIAASTHGFVGADMVALCQEATMCALRRVVLQRTCRGASALPALQQADLAPEPLKVDAEDFAAARARIRPSGMREVALELPRVSWADVGGHAAVKQRLQEAVQWPQQHPALLKRLGAKAPRGVLLFGPPGCSKTLLARAVASESGLNFLAVKGPELFSKYVGASEKAIVALFSRARMAAPSIIFFDEIDGLAAARGDADSAGGPPVGERVLSQLLVEMDGLQARGDVVVVAATNRPDLVDAALLRPGRFDSRLFVPPPAGPAERAAILRVLTRRTPLHPDADLDALATRTPGYTGADLHAVVREASVAALEQDTAAECVRMCHFDAALQAVSPSPGPSPSEAQMYAAFKRGAQ